MSSWVGVIVDGKGEGRGYVAVVDDDLVEVNNVFDAHRFSSPAPARLEASRLLDRLIGADAATDLFSVRVEAVTEGAAV